MKNSKSRADCNPEGLFTVIRRVNFSELLLRPIRANPFDKDFNPPLGIEWLLRNDPSGLKLFSVNVKIKTFNFWGKKLTFRPRLSRLVFNSKLNFREAFLGRNIWVKPQLFFSNINKEF